MTNSKMDSNVLVLNASYEAINICNVKRAVKMVLKGAAHAEEKSDELIHSPSMSMNIPLVIRLIEYVYIPHKSVKFSRKNVFTRDRYTCQYCHKRFPAAELTLDHVVPVSRGGKTRWNNIVTACKKCNRKKGGRTPGEANMSNPHPKAPPVYLHILRQLKSYHQSWKKYLYLD